MQSERRIIMNTVLEIIEKRRSIRKFEPEMIEPEELELILEAGRMAPSGSNSRTTHLFVISNPAFLEQLRVSVREAFAKMEYDNTTYKSKVHSIEASKKGTYVYDYNAPVLVVAGNKKGYANALADTACVLENMMIAATSLGVATCWINQLHWLDEEKSIREVFEKYGLTEDLTITGGLAIGYSTLLETLHKATKDEGNPVIYIR